MTNLRPKKWLGQHFLVDEDVLRTIVEVANLAPTDRVLEIGPGLGVLTGALSDAVPDGLVLAIERDRDLVDQLRDRFKNRRNVKIVAGDVLASGVEELIPVVPGSDRADYKVVANIPYAITSPIITKFLLGDYRGRAGSDTPRPTSITLLVQKEVAERLTAEPGTRERGVLTVLVELFGPATFVKAVPPAAFEPPPTVDSAIVRIEVGDPAAEPKSFLALLKAGFANKRRQLHNSLSGSLHLTSDEVRDLLAAADINPLLRAEQLTLNQWLTLLRAVRRHGQV